MQVLSKKSENRLFVVKKPIGISSNFFLGKVKRRYKSKSGGFSGTLDPFASGVLIVALGQYTKFFQYLKKSPKTYRAVLWFGVKSKTLDKDSIEEIINIKPFDEEIIKIVLNNLIGEIEYCPPKYSAKLIDGKRAYELARKNEEFELKPIKSKIERVDFLHYRHPFLTFEITISEGGYVRSIGDLIAKNLDTIGALSYLERKNEGDFFYENEKELNPLKYLTIEENKYYGEIENIVHGKKITNENFEIKDDGIYYLKYENFISILEIKEQKIKYLSNRIEYVNID